MLEQDFWLPQTSGRRAEIINLIWLYPSHTESVLQLSGFIEVLDINITQPFKKYFRFFCTVGKEKEKLILIAFSNWFSLQNPSHNWVEEVLIAGHFNMIRHLFEQYSWFSYTGGREKTTSNYYSLYLPFTIPFTI